MGEHDQYKPSKDEFLITGLFGSFLYILLSILIIYTLLKYKRNVLIHTFFISMFLMCIFEIPRFLSIAILQDYQSKLFYIFHLISTIFFFISFSLVCIQWSTLLKLGTYISIVYSYQGIFIANLLFGIIDFIAMIKCGISPSLHQFFRSNFFLWFTFLDTFKNLLYSSLLSFYGLKLILKFYRYNTIELTYNLFQNDQTVYKNSFYGQKKTAFGIALKKLTIVLFLSTLCFIIRIIMLISKIIALRGNILVSSPTIPLFGFLWFCLSDFIPRSIPSLAFVYLMSMNKGDYRRNNTNSNDLLKGNYMKQDNYQRVSSGVENNKNNNNSIGGSGKDSSDHPFMMSNYYDNEDDENGSFDENSSYNHNGEEEEEEEEYDDDLSEYLSESNYTDDYLKKFLVSSNLSDDDDHLLDDRGTGQGEEDEEVIFFHSKNNEGNKDLNGKKIKLTRQHSAGSSKRASTPKSSSKTQPTLNRKHSSWASLSSGLSLNHFFSSSTKSTTTTTPFGSNNSPTTQSSSKNNNNSPKRSGSNSLSNNTKNNDRDRDRASDDGSNQNISMTLFTSLSQLTNSSGRVSPPGKNDGYNNPNPNSVTKRSIEV